MHAIIHDRQRSNRNSAASRSVQLAAVALHSFFMASGAHLVGMGIPVFVLRIWNSDLLSGVAISSPSLVYILTTILFGKISTRIGRKVCMILSLVSNLAIYSTFLALAIAGSVVGSSWMFPLILICRGGEGIAQGLFWPTLEARISDIAHLDANSPAQRSKLTGKGVSLFNLGWNAGLLFAAFSFWLIMAVDNLELVFLVSIGVQALNLAMYKISVDEAHPKSHVTLITNSNALDECGGDHVGSLLKPKTSIPVILGILLVFFYGFSLQWIYATTTNYCYSLGIVPVLGILEMLRLAMQTVTSTWFKHGARVKLETIITTTVSVVCLTVVIGYSASVNVHLLMILWFPILGAVMGTLYAESLNMVEVSGAPERKGRLMGLFESAGAIGNFSGPVVAGYITQATSTNPYPTSFFIGATTFACLVIAIALIVFAIHRKESKK